MALGTFLLLISAFYFGINLIDIVNEIAPNVIIINKVNSYLIYWFLFDLIIRFFVQKTSVVNAKPLMIIPIKSSSIIHYFLVKTLASLFNLLPLFIIVPFSIKLLAFGSSYLNVFFWSISIFFLTLFFNYVNVFINKNKYGFFTLTAFLVLLIGFNYFNLIDVYKLSETIFNKLFYVPYLVITPILLVIIIYVINFKFISNRLYLDSTNSKKTRSKSKSSLSWVNYFGETAPFLKNDIRLIWRNKKPMQQFLMSFTTIFYGFVFCLEIVVKQFPVAIIFTCILISGGFLLAFAQLIPSWDSEYYKLLMSQSFTYQRYLKSKWHLMSLATVLFLFFSAPYIYFGWDKFLIIVSGALFNIGINSFFTLYIGSLNKTPIILNKGLDVFDTNKFSLIQIILGSFKLVLPVIIFYIPYLIFDFNIGVAVIGISGLLGIVFRNHILSFVANSYKNRKHITIAAYADKS